MCVIVAPRDAGSEPSSYVRGRAKTGHFCTPTVEKQIINTEKAPKAARRYYSQAVKAGGFVFVSGLTAHDLDGKIVGVGDAKAQAIQTFTNVKAVVEEAGSTLEDVVKVTVYVTNIGDLAKVAEARDQFFSKSPTASATVEVKGLAHKDMLIEVEAIAIARGG